MDESYKILFTDDGSADRLAESFSEVAKASENTNKVVLDLGTSANKMTSALTAAASANKSYAESLGNAKGNAKGVEDVLNKVEGAASKSKDMMNAFAAEMSSGLAQSTKYLSGFQQRSLGTVESVKDIVRAEKLLNVSLSGTTAAFEKESAALSSMLARYKQGEGASDGLRVSNEQLIAQAKRFSEVEQNLIRDLDRVESVMHSLHALNDINGVKVKGGDQLASYIQYIDNALLSSKDLERTSMLLQQRINTLQKELGESGTEEYAAKTAKLSEYQDAYNRTLQRTVVLKRQERSANASGIFGKGNQDTVAGLANLRRLGAVSPQIAQMSYVLDTITSAGMAASVATIGLGTAVIALGTKALKTSAELQQYSITLQSLSTHGWDAADKSLIASRALGKAVNAEMLAYASGSIYAFDKIAEGTEKLVGYGIDMRLVNHEMEMLGNLALGDSKRLENLSIAYGQVFGQGKARAQEMYQFVNAGIPIFELLAKKLNISTAAVMDMTRNGEVSFKLIRELLKDITKEGGKYHDLMRSVADMSLNGQWTMFLNQMKLTMDDIGQTLLPGVTALLREVNETLDKHRKQSEFKETLKKLDKAPYLSTQAQMAITGEMSDTALYTATGNYRALQAFKGKYGDLSGLSAATSVKDSAGRAAAALSVVPGAAPASAVLLAASFVPDEKLKPIMDVFREFNKNIEAAGASVRGSNGVGREGILRNKLSGSVAELRELGVDDTTISKYLVKTLFAGVDKEARKIYERMTPEEIYSNATVFSGADAVRKATSEAISGDLLGLYDEVQKGAIERFNYLNSYNLTPEQRDMLYREEDARKRGELNAEEGMTGGGAGGDGKGSKYKLDEYNEAKRKETLTMTQLVPLYQEYVRIHDLYMQDVASGMSVEDAKAKELVAKALYRQVEALNQVNAAYADIYNSTYGKASPMSSAEVDKMFSELDAQIAAKSPGELTERDEMYKNSEPFRKALKDALMSGTTLAEAHDVVKQLNRAFGVELNESGDAVSVALRNYKEILTVYKELGKISDSDMVQAGAWAEALGPDMATKIIATLGDYRQALSDEEQSALAALQAYKYLNAARAGGTKVSEETQYRSRKGAIAAASALSESLNIHTGSGTRISGILANPEQYQVNDDNVLNPDYKMGAIRGFFAKHSQYGDVTSNISEYSAESSKYEAAKKKLDNMKGDPLIDSAAIAGQQAEVDKLAESVANLGKKLIYSADSSKILGDTWQKIKSVGIEALTGTLNESFYQLGATLGDSNRSFEDYQRNVAAIVEQMAQSLPTILLQAAMSAFMTRGMFFVGLGLLAAAGVTGVINGAMGVGAEAEESASSEQDVISNLQEQLQTMMSQFQDMLSYLDIARNNYIASEQAAQIAGYAKGDVFPGTTGLAQGVYTSPTFFRFANGAQFNGVMGEAGAEAIMPLTRGADGRLGVAAQGAGAAPVKIVIENYGDATEVTDTREGVAADGGRQVTLVIEKAVKSMVASGTLDGTFRQRYNLRTPAIRRSN